jgi:hypothetical protein
MKKKVKLHFEEPDRLSRTEQFFAWLGTLVIAVIIWVVVVALYNKCN